MVLYVQWHVEKITCFTIKQEISIKLSMYNFFCGNKIDFRQSFSGQTHKHLTNFYRHWNIFLTLHTRVLPGYIIEGEHASRLEVRTRWMVLIQALNCHRQFRKVFPRTVGALKFLRDETKGTFQWKSRYSRVQCQSVGYSRSCCRSSVRRKEQGSGRRTRPAGDCLINKQQQSKHPTHRGSR